MGVVIVEGEGAVLAVNLGSLIVTHGGRRSDVDLPILLWAGLVNFYNPETIVL